MRWPFPPLPRAIPLGLIGTLALIAAVEGFLARHDRWFTMMDADAWRQARQAAEHPQSGGILIFGDSQAQMGLSPITVESRLAQPVQCMAVPGGQATSSYVLLRAALAAGTIPSTIVVDFEPNLLRWDRMPNRRMWSELATLGESLDLAWTMRDAGEFLNMACTGALLSYRWRIDIRDDVLAALRGWPSARRGMIASGRRNRGMNEGGVLLSKQPPGFLPDITEMGNMARWAWAPDPANEAYARRFLDLAASRKIPVFCVMMPVSPRLHAIAAASGIEAAHAAWLRRLQESYPNLFVLDWRDAGYPDSLFFDAMHLDVEGAASAGAALADYLGRCNRGEGLDRRWVAMPGPRTDGSYLSLEDHGRSELVVRSAEAQGHLRR